MTKNKILVSIGRPGPGVLPPPGGNKGGGGGFWAKSTLLASAISTMLNFLSRFIIWVQLSCKIKKKNIVSKKIATKVPLEVFL